MRIKELREEKNLTQSDVARGIQTKQQNISRWEKGEVLPTSDFIVKLADFFDVSTDYLLGRSDDLGNVSVLHSSPALTQSEGELLRLFRLISPSLQETAIKTLQIWAGAPGESALPKKA